MPLRPGRPIDWANIEAEYQSIREIVDGIRLPTRDEIDCYKASLAAPTLVTSDLSHRLLLGYANPLVQGADRLWMFDQIAVTLGFGNKGALPEHILRGLRNHFRVIECAVEKRLLSLEFLYSWGEIQKALGGLIALLVGDEAVRKDFDKGMKAAVASRDSTLQRYWYAHWMARAEFPKGKKKEELEDIIADLCADLKKKRRKPHLYKPSWFGSMIEDNDPEGGWALKTTFTRLKRSEIERLVNNHLIPLSALPPLSEEEFLPIGGYVP